MTNTRRKIEIFSAGCAVCEDVVQDVQNAACDSCDVHVLDMGTPEVRQRAADLGVKSVPAVAIDGVLAHCCATRGVNIDVLRAAGLGREATT